MKFINIRMLYRLRCSQQSPEHSHAIQVVSKGKFPFRIKQKMLMNHENKEGRNSRLWDPVHTEDKGT